ncbi:hypothetical protein [Murimonas intestini]|uniref:hypothetical protein n=1 Tax=Murimonas intestini TaxID=1337051 RepID=UPI0011DDF616|nr:hypothetical protein [Murimonas intestini]
MKALKDHLLQAVNKAKECAGDKKGALPVSKMIQGNASLFPQTMNQDQASLTWAAAAKVKNHQSSEG